VSRFDDMVDGVFAPLRGKPRVDRAAALVSNLADYGFVWVVVALVKGRRRGPDRRRTVMALGAAGLSSLAVSRAAKSVVARQRPDEHVVATVRTPTTSSFPSGHTLAAFCTAFVLVDEGAQTAAAVGFASAVAASRVHLRAHHASDVVGGAVIGSMLGLGLRPIVNVVTPGTRRRPRPSRRGKGMARTDLLLQRL
jgi:membrane-associated phospholipid phosphatase